MSGHLFRPTHISLAETYNGSFPPTSILGLPDKLERFQYFFDRSAPVHLPVDHTAEELEFLELLQSPHSSSLFLQPNLLTLRVILNCPLCKFPMEQNVCLICY